MTNFIMIMLTLVIAVFTGLVFLVYERIEWLTGAMETHSDLQMRIEAKNAKIDLIWWDPSIEPFPTSAEHGKPINLNEIYCGLPPRLRKNKPTFLDRLRSLWERVKSGPAG